MKIMGFLIVFCFGQWGLAQSLIDKVDLGVSDRTDILAIYKSGELIFEEYRNGYHKNQKHKLWSVSKSITSLLVAKAAKQGRIDINKSICTYIDPTQLNDLEQCQITAEDILFWRSGIDWAEDYVSFQGSKSSVLTAQYGVGINNIADYYFSLPFNAVIENNWNYSTGDTHILSYLLRQVYSPMEYEALPWNGLFDPLGIKNATFERDHEGTYLGGSYIYLSHPSLFKIAEYVRTEMQDPTETPRGWWQNVLRPKQESRFTLKMVKDSEAPAIPAGHWWVNKPSNPGSQDVPWPKAPEDTFAAFGVFGQMMIIVPSEETVIIRLAQDIKGGFDKANLIDVALKYARESAR